MFEGIFAKSTLVGLTKCPLVSWINRTKKCKPLLRGHQRAITVVHCLKLCDFKCLTSTNRLDSICIFIVVSLAGLVGASKPGQLSSNWGGFVGFVNVPLCDDAGGCRGGRMVTKRVCFLNI